MFLPRLFYFYADLTLLKLKTLIRLGIVRDRAERKPNQQSTINNQQSTINNQQSRIPFISVVKIIQYQFRDRKFQYPTVQND
ncbi:hypothetical protein C7B64_00820 [Merismopedia glauca CCAP 1448/3]|uniref:Uncharacterized protein n=1 Tax=Merismopedia glauca CCAP 1448/3 TaxID=1296344 RepID=A0A2T1C9Y5_9CYAN|nr:hypothetical protein C7B64_00820 [Merismopedia glauca CCAP 1448/3]